MENITRDVVMDLWPLYVSGDASADTRALVDAFLQKDPKFEETLRGASREGIPHLEPPSLAPDHELRTLARVKRRLAGPQLMLLFAMLFTGLAFGRIVSDTSFDVSPRPFIATAVVAACFWITFLVRLFRARQDVLIRIRR
jgi:hypothetical protein